jgi:hypothetical protein
MLKTKLEDWYWLWKSRVRRLINALDWAWWIYKNDYDHSSGYAIDMLRRKLAKLEEEVRTDEIHSGQDKYARQIRIVLEHFKRSRESYRYYDHDFCMGDPDDPHGLFTKLPKAAKAKNHRMLKFIDDMEHWHDQQAWRLIAKWHNHWWT